MTRLGSSAATAAMEARAQARVIVDRPQAREFQPTDGLLDPMKADGFFVMGLDADIDEFIGTDLVEEASRTRIAERKRFPLPSARGSIGYSFGSKIIAERSWRGAPQSMTAMYEGMRERLFGARAYCDPGGEMLPRSLQSRAIGEGGVSVVYPGKKGSVIKFARSNYSAEKLHVVHAGLHVFGIRHLEIRSDDLALDVARLYGIVEQKRLPRDSIQLRQMTRDHKQLCEAALCDVADELGIEARDELEELVEQVREFNNDRLMHNEAYLRGYSLWDVTNMMRNDRYRTFVCDAFGSEHWNENVFFNPAPSMRWFLLDW